MSYTNGILNHDDSQGLSKIGLRGLPGIGFKLDANNDYDMQNKKLVNVKQGTNNNDVVTKSYLDSEIANIPSVDTSQFMLKAGDTMTGSLISQKTIIQFMVISTRLSVMNRKERYSCQRRKEVEWSNILTWVV